MARFILEDSAPEVPTSKRFVLEDEAPISEREQEVQDYEAKGGGVLSSLEKGARRIAQSYQATGIDEALKTKESNQELYNLTGLPFFKTSVNDLAGVAQKNADNVMAQQNAIDAIPTHPTLSRAVQAANQANGFIPTTKAFMGELADSPDKLGLLADFTAEQVPNFATQAAFSLGTAGAGAIPSMGLSGFGSSQLSSYGPNVAEGLQKGMPLEEAVSRARTQSGVQGGIDALTNAIVPLKIGGSHLTNIPAQTAIQAAGGAGGEAASRYAIGETPDKGELIVEGLGETIGLPGDIATASFTKARHQVGQLKKRFALEDDAPQQQEMPLLPSPSLSRRDQAAQRLQQAQEGTMNNEAILQPSVPASGRFMLEDSSLSETANTMSTPDSSQQRTSLPPLQAQGSAKTIYTSAGRPVDVEDVIMDARDLKTSQLDNGATNPEYPKELQPRDRSRKASALQINDIAHNLRPDEMIISAKASDGAPIIAPDGVVESGNGRTLALRKAYELGKGENYRRRLQEMGYSVDGIEQPILVRRRVTPLDENNRLAFTREANERDTLALSSTERAMADAQAIPAALLDDYRGGEVTAASNRGFIRRFAENVLSPADRAAFIRPDGSISQEGVRRMQAAILAKAYEDPGIISTMTEDTDSNIRSIGGAMLDVAPTWARMKEYARSGSINPSMDITKNLLEATRLVRRAREEGTPIASLLNQKDIFKGVVDPITADIARLYFFRDVNKPNSYVSREKLAKALQYYAEESLKSTPAGTGLFNDQAAITPQDVLPLGRRRFVDEGTTATQSDLLRGSTASGSNAPAGNVNESSVYSGESSSESGRGDAGSSDVGIRKTDDAGSNVSPEAANELMSKFYSTPFDPDLFKEVYTKVLKPGLGLPAAQAKKWAEARREMLKDMGVYDREKSTFSDKAKAGAQTIYDFHNLILASNDGYLAALQKRYNSPTIQKIKDMLWSDAGRGRSVAETYEEGVNRYSGSMLNRLARAVEPLGKDREALNKIARLVQNRDQLRPSVNKLHEAAAAIATLLDENYRYLTKSGVEINPVEGYFPRVYDPTAIANNPDGFVNRAIQMYRHDFPEMTLEEAKSKAEAWRDNTILGGQKSSNNGFGRDYGVMPIPSHLKNRVLSKAADEIMKPFLVQNPVDALSLFFHRSARRAEWEKRLGQDQWKAYRDAMVKEGVPTDDIAEVEKAIESATGVVPSRLSPRTRNRLSNLRLWSSYTFLVRATVSSLGEPAMIGIRAGSPSAMVSGFKNSFAALLGNSNMEAKREILEDVLGMAGKLVEDMAIHQRFGDVDLDSKEVRYKSARFYRMIGLTQWTEATKVAAFTSGQEFINQLAKDVVKRGNKFKSAQYLMQEMGIPQGEAEAFSQWVLNENGNPTKESLLQDNRMADIYKVAVQRFVDQSIMSPKRAERPRYANHPIGSFFYSLQGYINSFSKNVLLRDARLLAEATTKGGYTLQDRLALAAPAMMLPLYLGVAAGASELRDLLFYNPAAAKRNAAQNFGTYWSRAGFFGNYDPLVNLVMGLRYNRDPATTLAGPMGGNFSELFSSGVKYFTQNSKNTNTGERKLAKDFYNVILQPVIAGGIIKNVPGGALPAAAIQGVAHPYIREQFIKAIAGKEQRHGAIKLAR